MRCSPGSETKEGPVGGELRRRVAGGARWRGTVVELQASGLPGSTPGRAVRVKRGLGWSGGRRRHGNRGGRATSRRGVPGEIPGAGVTRSGAKELEDDPGVEAEPVRSLDGAQVRRSCDSTAAAG